jgi:hypothetical protein
MEDTERRQDQSAQRPATPAQPTLRAEAVADPYFQHRAALIAARPEARLALPPFVISRLATVLQRSQGNGRTAQLLRQEAHGSGAAHAQDEELDRLLDRIGLASRAPAVPTFEAITSTTTAEFSAGELEQQVQRLWHRHRLSFTEAARRIAADDNRRGPRATSSAHLRPAHGDYAVRWAVDLAAYDYRRWGDLPEIARLLRRGSPFQRALDAEADHVVPVPNPTAAQIRSQIFDATMGLWQRLGSGEIGELVVMFSGHGGGGGISGVDEQSIGPDELTRMARMARDFNVHVVFVLDTCRASQLALFASAEAGRDLEERAQNLPADRRQRVIARSAQVTAIGGFITRIGGAAYAIGDLLRHRGGSVPYTDLMAQYRRLADAADDLGARVRAPAFSLEGVPDAGPLRQAYEQYLVASLAALAGSRRAGRALLRSVAVLLDTSQDAINQIIEKAQNESGASASAP